MAPTSWHFGHSSFAPPLLRIEQANRVCQAYDPSGLMLSSCYMHALAPVRSFLIGAPLVSGTSIYTASGQAIGHADPHSRSSKTPWLGIFFEVPTAISAKVLAWPGWWLLPTA